MTGNEDNVIVSPRAMYSIDKQYDEFRYVIQSGSHDIELRDYVWGSMRYHEYRSSIIVGMCSGHVHAYPNPSGHTLKS